MPNWTEISALIMGLVFAVGFFRSKTPGFGPFSTGVLILVMVLVFSALLAAQGKLEITAFTHIGAIALGFAGGLLQKPESK